VVDRGVLAEGEDQKVTNFREYEIRKTNEIDKIFEQSNQPVSQHTAVHSINLYYPAGGLIIQQIMEHALGLL
jgi:hypothetical protein